MLDDYYVESNKFSHYPVFDGDDNTKERVVAHLEQNGMPVRYSGESHRPADNGRRYDWSARLEFEGDRKQCQHELARILSLTDQQKPPVATWHVESNTYGHYLAFDFDSEQEEERDAQFGQIVTALGKAGISVKSDGESRRPADNGTQYDWYIRTDIALDETSGGALRKIKRALGPVASVPSAPTLLEETNEAKLKVSRLQKEIRLLQYRNEELQNKLQEQKTGPGADAEANTQKLQQENDNLRQDNDKLQQGNDELWAQWTEADDAAQHLSLNNHALKTKWADLEHGCAQLQGQLSRPPNHFKALLGILCGRVRLDEDSFSVINRGFRKIEPLITALQRYDHGEKQALKKLHGFTHDIWELAPPEGHISTGKPEVGSLGRVYFRRTAEGDPVAFVRVKQNDTEQQRALRLIDKYDLKDSLGLG